VIFRSYFSIVIPSFNRAALISRAIDSCLAQEFTDFEVLVVDDASTDGTLDVVGGYGDPRIRVVRQGARRGVCPARNAGVAAAAGDWIVFLDSDDELAAGALGLFHAKTHEVGGDVHHLRFMCRWDNGRLSPIPPLSEEAWDYLGFVRFVERCVGGNSETMSCIRAATFTTVRFPDDRSYETLYHLDFALHFKTRTYPEVARLYHTDAGDQISFAPNPAHWLSVAPDHFRSLETALVRHGAVLRQHAPRAYNELLRSAAKFAFLAGRRRRALALLLTLARRAPLTPKSWALLVVGSIGPRTLARVDGVRATLSRLSPHC
jgi:glycosyltransferase involved in cell wall biosynthesis